MNENFKLGIIKALIGAAVPSVLSEIFRRTRPKKPVMEDLVDAIDWDEEYRKLMKEARKKESRKQRKKGKARD